ncbi:hypothetical protein LTR08_001911 [Meristemomyces frigidus]|nr:hypothetical protein LTR08_001911 [Meristemomyces frigidus]
MNTTPKYKLAVANASAASKTHPCCDVAHKHEPYLARYDCSLAKLLYLYGDGSLAILHAAEPIKPGFLVRPPNEISKALLETHIAQDQAVIAPKESSNIKATRIAPKESSDIVATDVVDTDVIDRSGVHAPCTNEDWEAIEGVDIEEDYEIVAGI